MALKSSLSALSFGTFDFSVPGSAEIDMLAIAPTIADSLEIGPDTYIAYVTTANFIKIDKVDASGTISAVGNIDCSVHG